MSSDPPIDPRHRSETPAPSSEVPPAVSDFLDDLALRGRALTARTSGDTLRVFCRWLDARGVDVVAATAADLADYQAFLASDYRTKDNKPLARSTLSMRVSVIKGFYRWLAIRGKIIADPSRRMTVHYVRSRVVVHEPLTLQEATALVQTQAMFVTKAKQGSHTHAEALRNLAAICLAMATGRRIGGMTTMRVDCLDLERKELRVEWEKGHAGRVLPIAEWAAEIVGIYLRDARPLLTRGHETPWLLLNGAGDGPITRDALAWMLENLVKRTIRENPDLDELPTKRLSWHSLRVSFATLLFSNGCPIRSVNELLLHRCLSTTARYTPIHIEDMRQVFRTAHPRP